VDANLLGDDWIATLPVIYFKIQKTIQNPDSSFGEIADIIKGDPNLTTRLLRIVNSSYYGFSAKIETVAHALNVIGTQQLTDLVLAASVVSQFKGGNQKCVAMDAFWKHSLGCGLAAKSLASQNGEEDPDRFYAMGMLHDLGSLIVFNKMPNRSIKIVEESSKRNEPLFFLERESFGFDHSVVAEALLKAWELPDRLIEPIACHHDPGKSKNFPTEAAILHLGDIMAYELTLGGSGSSVIPLVKLEAWDMVGLSEKKWNEVKEFVKEEFDSAVGMFLSDS